MMPFHHFLLICLIIIPILPDSSNSESSTCLIVYREGGAPAVLESPKCPRWKLPNYDARPPPRASTCQVAVHQGRRPRQEDRTFCNLDVRIPFPGPSGIMNVVVGIVAIFDGHNGAEASDMASNLLLEYFLLHAYFLLDATYSVALKKSIGRLPDKELDAFLPVLNWDETNHHEVTLGRHKRTIPAVFDGSFHLEILKESLLRAIHDIDATFSKEASRYNLDSGSTATVILIADGQILAANVGDSKALLCSEKFQSPAEAKATLLRLYQQKRRNGDIPRVKGLGRFNLVGTSDLAHFTVKELTRDHHLDRDDERSRVENAGGYVYSRSGVPRVNGELAVSRAIGDLPFKRYGVISAPEMTDWLPLASNDSYLVAASDGIFEKLSSQDVCDLLWEVHNDTEKSEVSSLCSHSLADCLVNAAFGNGSTDNMAAIVVPLGSSGSSDSLVQKRCGLNGDPTSSMVGIQKYRSEQPYGIISGIAQMDHAHPVLAKFDRLLVESRHGTVGCFYLYENLTADVYYTPEPPHKDDKSAYVFDLSHALPDALENHCGGPLNFYRDQSFCSYFGMTNGGAKDQCINPEGLARFFGLLESIPFHDNGSKHKSFEYATPNLRYTLRKRFDRGSYGEVWLAFHWNCSQAGDPPNLKEKKQHSSYKFTHLGSDNRNTKNDCHAGRSDDKLFILKRILVERGTAVYLSGLREKYFGEIFVNASSCLEGLLLSGTSSSILEETKLGFYDLLEESNHSADYEVEDTWSSTGILAGTVYEEGLNHIARYVESFESHSNEIWLVFQHEGISLSKLIYTVEKVDNSTDEKMSERVNHVLVMHPSNWWHWLKTTEAGKEEMRNIIWQLLMALKSCHDRNITHRDIKPENMVICFEDQETGSCFRGIPTGDQNFTTKMRIIDFGSAVDEFTLKHLYGAAGPSRAEQTSEYTPPEALLNATWYQGPAKRTVKYDMWSVGVVMLEMILGSPNVFQVNPVTRVLLDQHLEGWNDDLKELAYRLRSFMELCILTPGSSSRHVGKAKYRGGVSPASWKCSEEFFSHHIKSRDPLLLGFPNIWAMRLVRQLLQWDPDDRLSVDEALRHPYFQEYPKKTS